MVAESFISHKIKFKGNTAAVATAVSFFVIIVAVAVSSGFRHTIREGITAMTGDIKITPYTSGSGDPVSMPKHIYSEGQILDLHGVKEIVPVVTRAGIVKNGETVHGVVIKGVPNQSDSALHVSIPHRLAEITGLQVGDHLTTYFIGEKVRARRFTVGNIHRDMVETDDNLLIYANIEDMQRLNGWSQDQVSSLEVRMNYTSREALEKAEETIGTIMMRSPDPTENGLWVRSAPRTYPHIFDWLDLLDVNVIIILSLMALVAGFNMVSGLLVMLLRNIPLIGTLKALGMRDASIGRVFVKIGSIAVAKGMLIGNALAFIFCLIQGTTHIIPLDPANYFVSWVPVHLPLTGIVLADAGAFLVILVLMWLPTLTISNIDPAQTVKAD